MCSSSPTTNTTERGFTLIEVMVAGMIAAIFISGFVTFYISHQRRFRETYAEIETSQALRGALGRIVREVRLAGLNSSLRASVPAIVYAAKEEIWLAADLNGDGDMLDADEVRGFRTSGEGLQMFSQGTMPQWARIADWIRPGTADNPTFRYFLPDGSEFTSLPAIPVEASSSAEEIDVLEPDEDDEAETLDDEPAPEPELSEINRVAITLAAERSLRRDGRILKLTPGATAVVRLRNIF